MQVEALTKFARMSPMKVRDVAREIQGRNAAEALELLRFIPRKSARLLSKTLQSAIANAENNENLVADDLTILKAVVESGPAFKRYQPVARGSAHPIRKRTSHIRIVLTDEGPGDLFDQEDEMTSGEEDEEGEGSEGSAGEASDGTENEVEATGSEKTN